MLSKFNAFAGVEGSYHFVFVWFVRFVFFLRLRAITLKYFVQIQLNVKLTLNFFIYLKLFNCTSRKTSQDFDSNSNKKVL